MKISSRGLSIFNGDLLKEIDVIIGHDEEDQKGTASTCSTVGHPRTNTSSDPTIRAPLTRDNRDVNPPPALKDLKSAGEAANWAHRVLGVKNSLIVADADLY
jgi:hypothetical protein